MPAYNASAIVVHRTDLGEYDRILTLFTRENGKLSAVAKGARRAASRLTGATELFVHARLQLATGKSLDIVTQCEIAQSFSGLRTDLQRLSRATYMCELLDRFTGERDEASSHELFDLTIGALMLLQRADGYLDAVVHAFELRVLRTLGYAPAMERCVVCDGALGRGAGFSPALGGAVCAADRHRAADAAPLSVEATDLLRALQQGDAELLLALAPPPKVAAEAAKALRWFVRYRSDRPLKSVDFLDQLRASH